MTDLLSIASFAAAQLIRDLWTLDKDNVHTMDIDYIVFDGAPIVEISNYRKVQTMSRTAQIMSDLRSANRAAIESFTADVDDQVTAKGTTMRRNGVIRTGGARYTLASGKGRTEALATAQIMLQGTEAWSMNNAKRDHSLPKRALSMASSRGRATPDMLHSLMAFFASPSGMAETLLSSFLPTKVSTEQAKGLLADPFVVDVIEGLGRKVPTAAEAVKLVRNPCNSRAGGARRVTIYSPGKAATVDAKRRGRPSGPKYVDYLPPTSDVATAAALVLTGPRPIYTCERIDGVPSSEGGAMAGKGYTYGIGWSEAWLVGRALTPAQNMRRNVALDAFNAAVKRQADADADAG